MRDGKGRIMVTAMGIFLGWTATASTQAPKPAGAAEIQLALKKLRVLASALYVGAHPDDENTDLIAYLTKGRLADAAYLSLTRGDGGQNLIGPEIGELLGIIRSQELLAARRIDGGSQFFTRAVDFGFSKTPEETLRIWNRDQVLSDAVRVIRQFQPDVVITRFSAAPGRSTHGHHTASARLAREAVEGAADPKRFPEQLDLLSPWKVKRILWNTSSWFYDPAETFDKSALLAIDVGEYSPLLGVTFAELAAQSSSMHKSQGFGSGATHGESLEYLEHVEGERAKSDLFEGVDTSWGRIAGGKPVGEVLDRAYREYDPEHPAFVVPLLIEARGRLASLPAGRWKDVKLGELDRVIVACLGLHLEAAAGANTASPGDTVKVELEAANRSPVPIALKRVSIPASRTETAWGQSLDGREGKKKSLEVALPADLPDSQPYWLRQKGTTGMFRVDDPALIGSPENRPALTAVFAFEVNGTPFSVERPVVYKWTDPVRGELYQPFEVVPAVAVDVAESVFVFPDADAREVPVRVRAGRAGMQGTLRLDLPAGWKSTPPSREFRLEVKDVPATLKFEVRPPAAPSSGSLRAVAEAGGKRYDRGRLHIEHPHIPTQVFLPAAEARVVRLDLKRRGETIGYVQGAGDRIPAGLKQVGYNVVELDVQDLVPESLGKLDAVILGVRAYNTVEGIQASQPALHEYVKTGGTLVVQYNTSHELKVESVAPYPLKISRQRVTEENAAVRFLRPEHPVLNEPNKITPADFEGWVQERGLYFPSEWDGAFQAVLSSNDEGESPCDGGLLVAKHGEGYFVYTGYSWFRQIPAGVPGAYRLFVNLISLGAPPRADRR